MLSIALLREQVKLLKVRARIALHRLNLWLGAKEKLPP